ncbi:MAG: PfkB family carbohydrate kinase [Chloroflexota bacterium]
MRRVVCMGAAALDLIATVDGPLGIDQRVVAHDAVLTGGGVAATAAVALARLGVDVSIVGTVGDDDASRLVRAGLEAEGVEVGALRSVPGRPAMSPILVDRATGARAIAAFHPDEPPLIDAAAVERGAGAAWVHVDHLGWRSVRALRAAGVTTPISLDHGNPTPDVDLALIDLYAPTEARLLERFPGLSTEAAIRAALGEGPRIVAVTRGAGGSLAGWRAADGEVRLTDAPAFPVEVVSTLGAGDVFHGALLAALVRDLPVPDALRHANAAAALSCRALDGRSAVPDWAGLERFLAATPR